MAASSEPGSVSGPLRLVPYVPQPAGATSPSVSAAAQRGATAPAPRGLGAGVKLACAVSKAAAERAGPPLQGRAPPRVLGKGWRLPDAASATASPSLSRGSSAGAPSPLPEDGMPITASSAARATSPGPRTRAPLLGAGVATASGMGAGAMLSPGASTESGACAGAVPGAMLQGGMPTVMPMAAMPIANAMQMQMAQMQQMQAAAMMQMQLGAMAQMQMAGMMPMVQMAVPMAAMMPMAQPVAAAEEPEEQVTPCSLEDISAVELEIKEAEKAAKASAKESGSFVGLMARYIEDEGFGFISCPECKEVWDKSDIFVSGRNFVSSGIDVGDMVSFQVEKDGKDLPRAVNPKTLEELTKLKRKLSKMREQFKVANTLKRSAAMHVAHDGGYAAMPDPKRMNLGMGFGFG